MRSAFITVAVVFSASAANTIAQSPDGLTRVVITSDYALGGYAVRANPMPLRFTLKEEAEAAGVQGNVRRHPLPGAIEYDANQVLAICLDEDREHDALERLLKLRPIDPAAVDCLTVFAAMDVDELREVSRFSNLRQLITDPSPALEVKEGLLELTKLRHLEYINLAAADAAPFGSSDFCKTVLKLPKLRCLSFPADKLSNKQLQLLSAHPHLEKLEVCTRKDLFDGETLRSLQRLRNLRELLIACTDDIRAEDLLGFAELKSLELLAITTSADPSIAEPLRRARPDLLIDISPREVE